MGPDILLAITNDLRRRFARRKPSELYKYDDDNVSFSICPIGEKYKYDIHLQLRESMLHIQINPIANTTTVDVFDLVESDSLDKIVKLVKSLA